jgi:hypothetical protein
MVQDSEAVTSSAFTHIARRSSHSGGRCPYVRSLRRHIAAMTHVPRSAGSWGHPHHPADPLLLRGPRTLPDRRTANVVLPPRRGWSGARRLRNSRSRCVVPPVQRHPVRPRDVSAPGAAVAPVSAGSSGLSWPAECVACARSSGE